MAIGLAVLGVTLGRRLRRRTPRIDPAELRERIGPRYLREAASRAEREGDLSLALRLYFSATIAELQGAGRLPAAFSLTVGQARRVLRSPSFDRAARVFEGAAYGGHRVVATDLDLVRSRQLVDALPTRTTG